MRNPERIDRIIAKLGVIWKKNPDLRFNQLILNLIKEYNKDYLGDDCFYMEDDKFEKILEDFNK